MLWRCPDGVDGNLKLASRPGPKGPETLIETRGAGGYVVVAPTDGYVVQCGGPATIQTITADERRQLLDLFASFDQTPIAPRTTIPTSRTATPHHNGDRPGDRYNATHTWHDVLGPHGWMLLHTDSRGVGYWRRPDRPANHPGHSATTNANGTDRLVVFSTSTPFTTSPTSYSKFEASTLLDHGGDYTVAARALTPNGHHTSRPPVELAPAVPDDPRDHSQPPPHDPDTGEILEPEPQPPADVTADPNVTGPKPAADDAGFWDARPIHQHIYDYARAHRVPPKLLLGLTLAQILSRIGPSVVTPAILGAEGGSLNTMHAMVGDSGDGKGIAYGASRYVLRYAVDVDEETLGSGEGLVDVFVTREREQIPKDEQKDEQKTDGEDKPRKSPKYRYVDRVKRTRCLLYAAEIDTIRALAERSGSTLQAELRKLWSGERLGFGYRTPEKAAKAAAHSYRATVIMGVQPQNAGTLIDDAKGGTPQRVCWWSTDDDEMPDDRPPRPDRPTWKLPDFPIDRWDRFLSKHVLAVCDEATREIDRAYVLRKRGQKDQALDGHAMMTRLKLAAALAFLDGHADVTVDDWELSATLMAWSDQARTAVLAQIAAEEQSRSRRRGQLDGVRKATAQSAETAETEERTRQVARKILKRLQEKHRGEGVNRNPLRSELRSDDRHYFDDAASSLIAGGLVTQRPVAGQGQPTVEYRAVQP